jgi:hypothetical protein
MEEVRNKADPWGRGEENHSEDGKMFARGYWERQTPQFSKVNCFW